MKSIKEVKEKSLKKIAKTIRSWFKLEIGFAQAHKEIGDVLESTISQTRQEVIEEIYTSGMIADGMYDPRRVVAYVDHLHRKLLEDLNKK